MKNIDWKELSPTTTVRDTGASYVATLADGTEALVCWGSQDAAKAQSTLARLAQRAGPKQGLILQAIRTVYHGPTNHRGSRITATASGGAKLTLPKDHSLDTDAAHRAAAEALAAKLGWPGDLIQGSLGDSYVFVFAPKSL